jgi:RHS repeat-associated protein
MKGSGTTATRFFYNESGQLLGEYTYDGTLIQETVWLADLPIATIKMNTLGDFGGDGKADVLWRHTSGGHVYLQPMDGFTPLSGDFIYAEPNLDWRIVAQGDVDGDRKQDIVWWNQTTGQTFIQLIDGLTIKASGVVYTEPNTAWRIVAAKDLDGDLKSDLVWWNSTTGLVYVQYLDGLTLKTAAYAVAQPSADWKLVGTGDATGDGKADLLWRNAVTGQVKLQTDVAQAGTVIYTEPNLDWKILAMADLNGDGRSDIVWKNSTTGQVFGQLLNGTTVTASAVIYTEPNQNWKLVHTADFNGDGKSDLLWRNTSQGDVFLQLMNGLSVAASQVIYNEADQGWKIVPAQDQTGSGSLLAAQTATTAKAKPSKRPNPPGWSALQFRTNALSVNTTAVYYVHPDHLGTPRAITRPSDNKVVWKWDNAEPFGNSMPNENPSGLGAFKFNLRFDGTYYDEETGKLHNGFRTLGPDIGRYLQSDPLGLVRPSTYAHVSSQPLKFTDRFGLLENFTFDVRKGNLSRECPSACPQKETPAFSGWKNSRNKPEDEDIPGTGPIPRGQYYITEPYPYQPSNPLSPYFFKLYRIDDKIDDETFINGKRRNEFRFHPGTISVGCVTTSPDDWSYLQYKLLRTETKNIPGTQTPYYGILTAK